MFLMSELVSDGTPDAGTVLTHLYQRLWSASHDVSRIKQETGEYSVEAAAQSKIESFAGVPSTDQLTTLGQAVYTEHLAIREGKHDLEHVEEYKREVRTELHEFLREIAGMAIVAESLNRNPNAVQHVRDSIMHLRPIITYGKVAEGTVMPPQPFMADDIFYLRPAQARYRLLGGHYGIRPIDAKSGLEVVKLTEKAS